MKTKESSEAQEKMEEFQHFVKSIHTRDQPYEVTTVRSDGGGEFDAGYDTRRLSRRNVEEHHFSSHLSSGHVTQELAAADTEGQLLRRYSWALALDTLVHVCASILLLAKYDHDIMYEWLKTWPLGLNHCAKSKGPLI